MDEDRIDVLFHMKNQSELIDKIPNDSIKPIEKLKQNFEQGQEFLLLERNVKLTNKNIYLFVRIDIFIY